MHNRTRILGVVLLIVLAGCTLNPPPSPPIVTSTSTPARSPLQSPSSAGTPVPMPARHPSATPPFPTASPVPALVPSPTPSCADIAPFSPSCLDQARPAELASEITFTGVLPVDAIREAAWSPDGRCLAYGMLTSTVGTASKVEVRCQPDFRLAGRWNVPSLLPFGLLWTLDSQSLLFFFLRDDASSIGLARMREPEWRDLFAGKEAPHSASIGREFAGWLNDTTLAFTHAVGTGVAKFHWLDISTGELLSSPDPKAFWGYDQLFSPDRRWLSANDFGGVLPRAVVWDLSRADQPIRLSSVFGTEHSDAQFWMEDSLGVVVYPPDTRMDCATLPHPDLYLWNAPSGTAQLVARGAFRAVAAPAGDRLAVVFFGEPQGEGQVVEATGDLPYLGLIEWPSRRLLNSYQLGSDAFSGILCIPDLVKPTWSPVGQWLAFPLYSGGLSLMDRGGSVQPVLSGRHVEWVGWGSDGYLAMLIDGSVWVVRVPLPGEK